MRTISVVTVGRSDWGLYLPILDAIRSQSDLRLHLIASGAHLVASHGRTDGLIVDDGYRIDDRVQMLLASDSAGAISASMGLGTIGFAQVYDRVRPDLLLVLGDRFEMHAAALAAVPFRIPIAHVHGGEVTAGAIDDALRHAITKYSHLHFASTVCHARRIVQLGEEPWRVTVSGAPGLDQLRRLKLLSTDELAARLHISLDVPPLLVTQHPVTLQSELAAQQADALLEAISTQNRPVIITRPNADTRHSDILERLERFAAANANVRLVSNLGTLGYFSLMQCAAAMVGNSSSGIIEAASFRLPVVNIGLRQLGRPRSGNVIDCGDSVAEIRVALEEALSGEFRARCRDIQNLYGDGYAADRIVRVLKTVDLSERLLIKSFHDLRTGALDGDFP
ncbi:MAG: UDP-N-acetylglucosamine 2-epimerase [Planctomycetaceae bacterium]